MAAAAAAGGSRRVTASMMKFKPNQTRTYDREGYKKRAACLCFRSEREDEVSPPSRRARGAGGAGPGPGGAPVPPSPAGSLCLAGGAGPSRGTTPCAHRVVLGLFPRSRGRRSRADPRPATCAGSGAGAPLAHHLGAGRGPTCAAPSFVRGGRRPSGRGGGAAAGRHRAPAETPGSSLACPPPAGRRLRCNGAWGAGLVLPLNRTPYPTLPGAGKGEDKNLACGKAVLPTKRVKRCLKMFCRAARGREGGVAVLVVEDSAQPGFYVAAESGGGNKVVLYS